MSKIYLNYQEKGDGLRVGLRAQNIEIVDEPGDLHYAEGPGGVNNATITAAAQAFLDAFSIQDCVSYYQSKLAEYAEFAKANVPPPNLGALDLVVWLDAHPDDKARIGQYDVDLANHNAALSGFIETTDFQGAIDYYLGSGWIKPVLA